MYKLRNLPLEKTSPLKISKAQQVSINLLQHNDTPKAPQPKILETINIYANFHNEVTSGTSQPGTSTMKNAHFELYFAILLSNGQINKS